MLKLGIFGDSTSNQELIRKLNRDPEIAISGVFFSGNVPAPDGFIEFFNPIELMDVTDAMLILNDKSISTDLIKLILRKSKHIYLKAVPSIGIKEIKELIDLEKEAGIVNYIYNPFDFFPHFSFLQKKYETPLLINLRTYLGSLFPKLTNEILLLITAVNRVAQSNYKKAEVFGLKDKKGELVINIRIEYENSSCANLTISSECVASYCEIFTSNGRLKYEFQELLSCSYPTIDQEYIAISSFIRTINLQEKQANSFDNLLNGIRIVNEVSEHLRFNEIHF